MAIGEEVDELLAAAERQIGRGQAKDAVRAASEALSSLQRGGDASQKRGALRTLASAHLANKDAGSSLRLVSEEVEKCKAAGDKAGEAEMMIILSDLKLMNAEPKKALEVAAAAESLIAGDRKWEATAIRASVYALLALGKKKEALKKAQQALALYQEAEDKGANDREGEAAAWAMLAHARLCAGRTEEAAVALKEAGAIYKALGDTVKQAKTLNSFAQLQLIECIDSKNKEALKAAQQARSLFIEAGKEELVLEAWDTSVAVYVAMGMGSMAVKEAKEEVAANRQGGSVEAQAVAEKMLARAYLRTGDEEGALQAAKRACVRMHSAGDWRGTAYMLHMAADLHLRHGKADLALKCAEEAHALLKSNRGRGREEGEEAELRTIIAEAHLLKGEEPPLTAPRAVALGALDALGKALEERQVQAFHEAMQQISKVGGLTSSERAAVIGPILAEDPSAHDFVAEHMPSSAPPKVEEDKAEMFSLREFPATPATGMVEGIEWAQSMGKVTLSFPLDNEDQKEDDIVVSLSGYQLVVTVGGRKLQALCGDFCEMVLPSRSWWMLYREEVKRRTRGVDVISHQNTLLIQVAKAEHKAWSKLWYKGDMKHPNAKGAYGWNELMHWEIQQNKQEVGTLTALAPGAFADQMEEGSDRFLYAPDDLCVAVDTSQDAQYVVVRVHFDGEALLSAQKKVPIEDLLAVDVWEDQLLVFLRGDEQHPILYGTLWGRCEPRLSSWKMTKSETFRSRQQDLASPCPVLEIKLVKSKDSKLSWSKIFSSCWQHRLMLKNYAELEEMMLRLQDDEEAQKQEEAEGRLSDAEKDAIYTRLMSWKEERHELMPGAKPLSDGGDAKGGDFAAGVRNVVEEIATRTGYTKRAKWNADLGRYSYIN